MSSSSSSRRVRTRRSIVPAVAVMAIGTLGLGASGAVNADTPTTTPAGMVALPPARILDTRLGTGAPAARVAPGQTVVLQVAGVAGVPADATAVVVNLTVTRADGSGYVTAYPGGGALPEASVINYTAGEDVANMVTVQLGAGGTLALYNAQATVDLLADVAGYFAPVQVAPPTAGPQLIDLTVAQGQGQLAGPFGGVRVQTVCSANQTFIQFNSTGTNALQVGGVGFAGTTTYSYDVNNAIGTQLSGANPAPPLHFSGLVRDTSVGETYQLELHMSPGNPCRVWGTATPIG